MNILGLNAYHGDVSAVLLQNGKLVAAIEEERFRRIKHWAGCPRDSVIACLKMAGIGPRDIDHFAVSRNPKANLARKAMFMARRRPSLATVADRVKNSVRVQDLATRLAENLGLERQAVERKMHWIEHHPAHLSSAFFVSPFDQAAVCAIDGFGDFVSTSFAVGRGASLDVIQRVFFPHSLGLLYLAITQYLGFMKFGDEFKVMGLAPYGKPSFADQLRRLRKLKPDGLFELDLDYFCHWSDAVPMKWDDGEPTLGRVFTPKLEQLLGSPARTPKDPLAERHEDIAASLQLVHEEAVFHLLKELYHRTKLPNLCLAGGCAMNSVANGKIREHTPFERVYIQPAAGDNGTSLGAAYYVWNQLLGQPRAFSMEHGYWGPEFGEAAIEQALTKRQSDIAAQNCQSKKICNQDELCCWTAERISEGKVVGWFQGRMEWGARALGNRSIVADPRRADMREIINTKIKFREKFRPFAPSVAEDALNDYFVGGCPDPFMIQVYPVRPEKRGIIPAVTHVDGSGRLQTVSAQSNPLYYKLIKTFASLTGVPVLLNTSFNENEPIVHTPEEALDCFLRTHMDHIVLGHYTVSKA
ncbi:MAG: carbamoyltransferase [Terriglobales bacterium]